MPVNSDIFKHATAVRDSVTKEQQAYIEGLYKQWSEDIKKQADHYGKLSIGSAEFSSQYYQHLYNQMQAQSKEIANGVYTNIKDGMAKVSDAVVKDAVDWMSGLGFSKKDTNMALSYIPQSTVNSLLTGSVYGGAGSWSLSSAIWGDNEKTLRDIYAIMGQGVAAQMGIYEMASMLSQYVDPSRKLAWQGPNGGLKIYKKAVDYNAQRLARTLVQHTYQQSFVAATKDNPFITEYVWLSNGPRVCPICADRDGKHFEKDKLPLDHPNGMCTMEPVVVKDLTDKLANWVNAEDGTYPELDAFALKMGYDPSKHKLPTMTMADVKKQFGNTGYKYFKPWYKKLPAEAQNAVDKLVNESGLNANQWFKQNISNAASKAATNAAKNAATKTADDITLSMQQMIEKYSQKLGQSSSGFQYLGKMSTDKMLGSLTDNEIDDIAEWAAKKLGLDISSGAKKDDAVVQWIKDAFGEINKMSYDDKWHLKDIANGLVKPSVPDATKTISQSIKSTVSSSYKKWIDDIKAHGLRGKKVQDWIDYMKAFERDIKGKLSREAVDAIETYSGSSYRQINKWLRNGGSDEAARDAGISDGLRDNIRKLIKEWNSDAVKTTEDYVLRRGTDLGDLAGLFMDGDFNDNKFSLMGKSPNELANMFVGQLGEYKGFTSTSSMYDRGFDGEVECIIKLPKGSSGMSILSISRYGDSEGEFLLNAGTKVICKAIEKSDGHMGSRIRVFLEVIV